MNRDSECLMASNRPVDNCYLIGLSNACKSVKTDDIVLWYKKLGCVNYRSIQKLLRLGVAIGLPNRNFEKIKVCGPCRKCKQVKVSHQMLSACTTTYYCELIHMKFTGPMETESIGGKRYSFVLVDDYSKYIWGWISYQNFFMFLKFFTKDLKLYLTWK